MGIRRCQERIQKRPTEILVRAIEIAESELGDSETLLTWTIDSVTPSGQLVALDVGIEGRVVEVSLEDGVAGTDYIVRGTVTTDGGQTLEVELLVEVRD